MADNYTYSFDLTPYMDQPEAKPEGLFGKNTEDKVEESKSLYQEMADMLKAYWSGTDSTPEFKPSSPSVDDDVEIGIYEQYSDVSPVYAEGIMESLNDAAVFSDVTPSNIEKYGDPLGAGVVTAVDGVPVTESAEPVEEAAPVATQGAGLMSRRLDNKDGNLAESYDSMEMDAYLDEFIPEMAQLEGMGGDVVLGDLEPTYSYGITEQKANEYGMRPDQFDTMEGFARAFAARYREEKEGMYSDIFTSDLDKQVERGLQSYLWNRGSFYRGQLRALRDNDLNGFIDELKDVISAKDRLAPNNQSRPMSGLSKRRAAEANLVGRGIEGYVPIATVETTGTQQRPIFVWRDAQGNELNRFAPQKQLHSQSTMGEVAVPE